MFLPPCTCPLEVWPSGYPLVYPHRDVWILPTYPGHPPPQGGTWDQAYPSPLWIDTRLCLKTLLCVTAKFSVLSLSGQKVEFPVFPCAVATLWFTRLFSCKATCQSSHFFRLTKFHDISMIFPCFFSKFPVIFSLFLKYDFQVVLNINMQTD